MCQQAYSWSSITLVSNCKTRKLGTGILSPVDSSIQSCYCTFFFPFTIHWVNSTSTASSSPFRMYSNNNLDSGNPLSLTTTVKLWLVTWYSIRRFFHISGSLLLWHPSDIVSHNLSIIPNNKIDGVPKLRRWRWFHFIFIVIIIDVQICRIFRRPFDKNLYGKIRLHRWLQTIGCEDCRFFAIAVLRVSHRHVFFSSSCLESQQMPNIPSKLLLIPMDNTTTCNNKGSRPWWRPQHVL